MPVVRPNPRPILVTGASGFAGEHLARELVEAGDSVIACGRSRDVAVPGAIAVRVDLAVERSVDELVRMYRPRLVYHLAALSDANRCERQPIQARQDIVEATRNLVRSVARHTPDAPFVGVSTDLVFNGENAPYDESSSPRPLSVYGECKLQAEREILAVERGAVVRASLLFGPRSTHQGCFLDWMLDALREHRPLALFEDEFRTVLSVGDLCRALSQWRTEGGTGLWHAGGPERISRWEMGQRVCRHLGLDIAGLQRKRRSEVPGIAPRPRDVSLDSSKLWSWLGWRPRSFEEGLSLVNVGHRPRDPR